MKCRSDSPFGPWLSLAIVISGYLMMLVNSGNSLKNEEVPLKKTLAKLCRNINSIRHLSEMQTLIDTIRSVKLAPAVDTNSTAGWRGDFLMLNPDVERPCLEQATSIMDLEPIITETNVCQLSHIELIMAYKRKHLLGMSNNIITSRFFNLYTNQVAFNCKHNLIKSLHLANEKFIDQNGYAKVMPWLADSNIECQLEENNLDHDKVDFELFYTEISRLGMTNGAGDTPALRCKAIGALTNVKSIHQLVEVLEHDFGESSTSIDSQSEQSKDQSQDNIRPSSRSTSLTLILPDNKRKTVEDMLEACSKFEQIYSQTIMPIVKLMQLGYNPSHKKFDEKCREDPLAQRWFSITLICNSMLRSRLSDDDCIQSDLQENVVNNKTGVIVVDDADDKIIINDQVHVEETDHKGVKTQDISEQLFTSPIEDELWIGKYLPGRFKRFRSKYVDNLIKVFKIDKLRESAIYKKNIKRGRSLIVTLIFVGLTLLGINSSSL